MKWRPGVVSAAIFVGMIVGAGFGVADAPLPQSGPEADLVTITEVQVRTTDHGPVVLLLAEGRAIPIFVDLTVAGSIQAALTGEKLPRPMSHDLMHTILETYGVAVTQTVISLQGGTYYGSLRVRFGGQEKVFDSRSSDSIALAVHFHAPILVGKALLESAGTLVHPPSRHEL